MLTGKHVNKYYIKYWYFFLIGIIALVAVDYFQLLIPEYLGNIVDSIKDGKEYLLLVCFLN
jgi:ATP-binding cassette subfamily B protein